jgi:hypothetical protein
MRTVPLETDEGGCGVHVVRRRNTFAEPHFHPQAHTRAKGLVIVTLHSDESPNVADSYT